MNKSMPPPWQQLRTGLQTSHLLTSNKVHCEQCQDALSLFITDELVGKPVDMLYPLVARHLDQCPICLAEYEGLSKLTELVLYG